MDDPHYGYAIDPQDGGRVSVRADRDSRAIVLTTDDTNSYSPVSLAPQEAVEVATAILREHNLLVTGRG